MTHPSDIVRVAREWVGTPYRHQGSLKGVGTDCLGLVRGVWREIAGCEPEATPAYSADAGEGETLAEAARRHMKEIPCADVRGGDLLLFRWRAHLPARHAGIATSETHMVHAQENACVTEIYLSNWWRRHLAFAFRFPGTDSE